MIGSTQLHLPHWANEQRWEENQRPVFEEICARFDEGHELVLADAPCGSGKSILGFMVHQYLETSGLILVGTKILQDQYEKSFGRDEIALIKGKANYIPLHIESAGSWKDPTCADCDLDESGLCSYCGIDGDECPYPVAREIAERARLVCTNMAYALGEWTSPRSRFRNRGLVILDEADTAAEEIRNHVSVSISPKMQKLLGLKSPEELLGRVKTVESAWPKWFDYAVPHVQKVMPKLPRSTLQDKRTRQTVERLSDRLQAVHGNLDGWIYEYARDFIEFKPVTVDQIAEQSLWKNGRRFLAMSASLGSPEQFVKDLGWEKSYGTVFAPSTFEATRRPIYVVPSAFMTKKKEATEWPLMGDALDVTIDQFEKKNILVHSHSYGLTKHLYERVGNNGRDVFCYLNSDTRKEAVSSFESTPGSVLIAPSLDRGYDNSDVDVAVICKVPFPYIGSKQVEKRWFGMPDGKMWAANMTAQAITQMYGRIMRSEDDEGICVILDSVFGRFYQEWAKMDREDGTKQHRLFASWVTEALQFESELRFDVRQELKKRALQSSRSS